MRRPGYALVGERARKENENTGKGSFLLLSTTTTTRRINGGSDQYEEISNGRVKTKNIGKYARARGRAGITI